jgi:hypothetical protein
VLEVLYSIYQTIFFIIKNGNGNFNPKYIFNSSVIKVSKQNTFNFLERGSKSVRCLEQYAFFSFKFKNDDDCILGEASCLLK